MIELLGPAPKSFSLAGKNSRWFFDRTGHLWKIWGLKYWPLKRVLMEKYRFVESEAVALSDFLMKILEWYPEKRQSAQELLEHPWLKMAKNEKVKMTDEEYENMMEEVRANEQKEKLAQALKGGTFSEVELSDEDLNAADIEGLMSDDDSLSLGHGDSDHERENLFAPGYGKGKALNNSFTGPYTNMDHIHTDKGPNP